MKKHTIIRFCKVCNEKHSCHGFCKYHAWAFSKGRIDIDGLPSKGYFYDQNMRLKKEKSTFAKTVKESSWYRKWVRDVIAKDWRTCSKCQKKGVRLVVHHLKRFAQIINDAQIKFDNITNQMLYCRKQHTVAIGSTLCLKCHAEAHKGEKMYSSLAGRAANGKCKICGVDEYCRKFCSRHYKSFQIGHIDIDGNRLKPQRMFDEKGSCIVCGKTSVGRGGRHHQFCSLHLSRFNNGIIDEKGRPLRDAREMTPNAQCKVCGDPHHCGKGFCLTHYNRFKVGQIDINGKELRELQTFSTKGSRLESSCIEFNGKKLSVKEWSIEIGISQNSLRKRLRNWGLEKALTTPKR